MSIKIPKIIVKGVLFFTKYFNDNKMVLVCKGYDGDYVNYTGLYWDEDRDMDAGDEEYEDFQLWIRR